MDEIVQTGDVVGSQVDTPKTADRNQLVARYKRSVHHINRINLPSVAVTGGEAHEAVGKLVLVNEAAELAALVRSVAHGLVVVADNSLGDQSREVVVRAPADTLDSESDVGSAHGIVTNTDIRANEVSLLLGLQVSLVHRALAGEAREVLLGQLNELLVGDATGSNENHAVGSIVVLDVVGELGAGDVADILARSQDGATERLMLESGSVQVVEDDLLDLLLDLLGLTEDDIALAFDGRLLELGVLENIGQDVDTLRDVGVEGLGEVDGVLALFPC